MESGVITEAEPDPVTDSKAKQKKIASPRVVQAASCIQAVMREQGLDIRDMDPNEEFNPDVRAILLGDTSTTS
jgi:hypothetical protein